MSESTAKDDLERLTRAGYVPRISGGYGQWVRADTGDVATLGELAAVLLDEPAAGLEWLTPRLEAAARLAQAQP